MSFLTRKLARHVFGFRLTQHSNWRVKPVTQSHAEWKWHGLDYHMSISSWASFDGTRLEIQNSRWPRALRLPYVWLRDHCRCPECYDVSTFQKIHHVCKIPLNIQPMVVETLDSHLEIKWPDNHISKYDYKFLWKNSYEGRLASLKPEQYLWTSRNSPPLSEVEVDSKDILESDAGLRLLLTKIGKYGFGIAKGVDCSVDATQEVVERIGPVRKTFFGEMWSFKADLEFSDSAYSTDYIGPHTDTTYFSRAIRIQVFHCLQAAAEGGDTLLVDGFACAQQLRKKHPEAYQYLSVTSFPSEYIEKGQHHQTLDRIFRHDPVTGDLIQFRYNIYDRAPLWSVPVEDTTKFYDSLQKLTRIAEDEKNHIWVKLEPGSVIFIDNWRVMHGRAAYSGPRIMGGCYMGQDSFTSKARLLNVLP